MLPRKVEETLSSHWILAFAKTSLFSSETCFGSHCEAEQNGANPTFKKLRVEKRSLVLQQGCSR